jgi:hypothetical protein
MNRVTRALLNGLVSGGSFNDNERVVFLNQKAARFPFFGTYGNGAGC